MDRRTFLAALTAAFAAPTVPISDLFMAQVPSHGLAFHPDAFSMAMEPLTIPINPPIINSSARRLQWRS